MADNILAHIHRRIYSRFPPSKGFLTLREVSTERTQNKIPRIIDYLVIDRGQKSIAIEVKTSRGNFLKEINNPHKTRAWMDIADQFWFLTPANVLTADDVNKMPEGCALYEATDKLIHTKGLHGAELRINDTPQQQRDKRAYIMQRAISKIIFAPWDTNIYDAHRAHTKATIEFITKNAYSKGYADAMNDRAESPPDSKALQYDPFWWGTKKRYNIPSE